MISFRKYAVAMCAIPLHVSALSSSFVQSAAMSTAGIKTEAAEPTIENDINTLYCRAKEHFAGSDEGHVRKLVIEYVMFLKLKIRMKDENAEKLSPSPLVDKIWHLHLLDTRSYKNTLDILCGRDKVDPPIFIHHNPDGGSDVTKREQRVQNTRLCYEAAYSREPDPQYWEATTLPPKAAAQTQTGDRAEASDAPPAKRPRPQSSFQIFVSDLNGEILPIGCDASHTVAQIKAVVAQQKGIPVDQSRLLFAGIQLEDDRTLQSYNIQDSSVLHVHLRMTGC